MNQIYREFSISPDTHQFVKRIEDSLTEEFKTLEEQAEINQLRVIRAMQNNNLSERHFFPSTGYGYNDVGREVVEAIYAEVFHGESALVRPQIFSGTHAIATALYGNLRPGDTLLSVTGDPYDTVKTFIGSEDYNGTGTLKDLGVKFKQVELKDNKLDLEKILEQIDDSTKMIYLQRSTGYSMRDPLDFKELKKDLERIKNRKKDLIIFLDNCYGEFVSTEEPLDYGFDLIAGSLIKNPGGGLTPTGGYVIGKKPYVENAANRLSAPGISLDTGATGNWPKQVLQGLFFAPTVTLSALKSALLLGKIFEELGHKVHPESHSARGDIIQAVELGNREAVEVFCESIQAAAPVDSFVKPEGWDMPGYHDEIIMAAGNFVQGSSIELSADAPLREPYNVFFQGGLTYFHGKLGILMAIENLKKKGLL